MKKELDSLLQTAEKAFAVELLTMPAAFRKMRRKEVLGESAWPCARGAGSGTDCSVEDMPNPKLVRTNSKKGRSTH
ncbi:BORE2 protein, partial [Peucedramus taeniatus]|nr:BORE2 protein [Peucedramus taeniatus]